MAGLVKWTEEQIQTLRQLYPNHTNRHIAPLVAHSESAVSVMAFKQGLKKDKEWMRSRSMKTAFRKGHVPANKGKKWDEYLTKEQQQRMKQTTFKKRNVPHNKQPIGHERKAKDGYWMVKVSEPNVFKMKHRVLWEQHHGPIPKGTRIMFIDGNPDNITIENLRAETQAEAFNRCCSLHVNLPPELRMLTQLKGALKRQINKIDNNV